MLETDIALRNITYALFIDLGRAPTVAEVGVAAGITTATASAAWQRLHDAHALVLHDDGTLRMANPFSAVPTGYRVEAAGRSWFANCAWDAFGIFAALHVGGRIETSCSDCDHPIDVVVQDAQLGDDTLVFHCLVPAAHWWDDIVFT